jgi:large subunit ribosomal protein L25
MDYIPLDLETRDVSGNLHQTRDSGYIPGIVYGQGMDPTPIQIKQTVFRDNVRHHGLNTVYSVNLNHQDMQAVIRDVQVDPLKKEYLHVDLQRITMDQEREAQVPIRIVGRKKAERDGVMNQQMEYIKVRGLPSEIPEYIEINVSDMQIGERFTVGDLMIPDNLLLENNPKEVILSLSSIHPITEDLNTQDDTPANAVPITGNDERETNATKPEKK